MELLFCISVSFVSGLVLGSAIYSQRVRRRDRYLRQLFEFMKRKGAHAVAERLPEEIEAEIDSGVNRMLDAIEGEFKTAERRGVEWERVVDSLEDVVCVLDSRGRIVRANAALAEKIGLDVRSTRGIPLEDLLYGDRAKAEREGPIAATRRNERPASGVISSSPLGKNLEIVTAPGQARDYGEALYVVGLRDRDRGASGESRSRRLGHLAARMPLPMIVSDLRNGQLTFANRAFMREFGYAEAEVEGLSVDDLLAPVDGEPPLDLRDVAHADWNKPLVAGMRRADGETVNVHLTGSIHRRPGVKPEILLVVVEARDEVAAAERVDGKPAVSEDRPHRRLSAQPAAKDDAEAA